MSETPASPASATPNQPAGALSLQQAVEERIAQKAAAAEAPTAESAPEPAADETEQPEAAPVDVDDADSDAEDANEPEEAAAEEEDEGDYIETPDGEKIPVEEAVQAHKNFKALQARVTRKEQALAEERRAWESDRQKDKGEYGSELAAVRAEREALAARAQEYAHRLKIVDSSIGDDDKQWATIDWERLENDDPIEAGRQWRAYERHEKRKVAIQREMQQAEAEQARAMEQNVREARGKFQAAVAEKYPELIDPKEGSAHRQAMLQTALDAGYTPQEIEQTLDPRALALWRKAALYDQMKAQKTTASAKPNAPKPDASGAFRVVKARGVSRPNVIPAPKAALGRAQAAFNSNPSFENGLALEAAKRVAGVRRG